MSIYKSAAALFVIVILFSHAATAQTAPSQSQDATESVTAPADV